MDEQSKILDEKIDFIKQMVSLISVNITLKSELDQKVLKKLETIDRRLKRINDGIN